MSARSDKNRIIIFDTTLRDGEQSPGASMNLDEKLRIAEILDTLDEAIRRRAIDAARGQRDKTVVLNERGRVAEAAGQDVEMLGLLLKRMAYNDFQLTTTRGQFAREFTPVQRN